MSVEKDASGRRSVRTAFEVPGSPEEVWQAIATGPGISSWLMPAEFEARDGKPATLKLDFGAGVQPCATVTTWDPPSTYASQADGLVPGSPPIATEWHIEARAGGTCVLRIVHSLFAATDDWDDQLEHIESGWSAFLVTLQVHLRHFRGQRAALMRWMVPVTSTQGQAWETLVAAWGLEGASAGQRWAAPADIPSASGVVEYVNAAPNDALIRLQEPVAGVVALGTVDMDGSCRVGMNVYLYGDQAAAIAARDRPLWQAWIDARFPAGQAAANHHIDTQ